MRIDFFCVFFLVNWVLGNPEENPESNLQIEADNGKKLVLSAINVLLFGEPEEQSYQDLFLDTSKGLLEQTDGGNDMVTVDDLIRIFFQSVIILSTSRRPDLIPIDFYRIFLKYIFSLFQKKFFSEKNAAYGEFVEQLNMIMDKLKEKGTDEVKIKDFRKIIKSKIFV